ncbi:DoxX family protein [Paraburkholderia fungorum]|jgi:putative oxidoreductase|uniref:DoxX family protein n=1 Tax=Paraburkholderia fungorum TaxID=134537 RepID=A0AAP1PJ79_9BURK|nr:DoxX family protein [Paraburkholderia fungorum]MBB4512619.1 putative oxidoreductase [Paraburkholderia fungorum]MBB6200524.1 putative oxidoreductase [Paraburkholderia fungorum]MBU7437810.1 DoxX family protein [Paraburkholderia fungorum]MDT8836741.1 DoxX family protein [Paraburkholderia fungorum]PRZ45869.1 putative oxidoreductase [Paraburkholderia fungorum]
MERFKFLPLLGRILIGAPFVMSGLGKLAAYGATVGYIAAMGLPVPPLAFILAVVTELGGGLLLLSGYRARTVSLGMAVFCVVTALFFHHNFADQNQMIHFLKNVMMAGGLLQITWFGAGAFSLDALTGRTALRVSPANAR